MRPLEEIFRRYGPLYIDRYGTSMPRSHLRVLQNLIRCGDGTIGSNLFGCPTCGLSHMRPCRCGDRHCPNCQHEKAGEWLQRQMERLLPCPYFLVTFTVPEQLRRWLRSHQRIGYDALFKAAAGALKQLARDQRFVGAHQIGFFGVLHTSGRALQYHPHIHFVVPGGGLSRDRSRWKASRKDLFVHVRPLAKIYRAKFRHIIRRAGLGRDIDPAVWEKPFNVNSQAVGTGKATLKYLARYVFRVAITNKRILSIKDGQVTFTYEDSRTRRMRKMSLDAGEFIRRFLQHVLPKGFMKIRYFGFLSHKAGTTLTEIRNMICLLFEVIQNIVEPPERPVTTGFPCPRCGKPLKWIAFLPAKGPPG
jgi:hypothetical protein